MKIKFLGAAGTVTGSGYLLTSNSGQQILIDLGMFQGNQQMDDLNYKNVEIEPKNLMGVVLTHAHLDHCGRLPILQKRGYKNNVYMTEPTANLTELSLLDTAKINIEDHPDKMLYDKSNVVNFLQKFKNIKYHQEFLVGDFKINFVDAGHILGSASVEIWVDGQKIVFSGDLGNTPEALTMPTEYIDSADVVVMESTYGDRLHPEEDPKQVLAGEIDTIYSTGGTLLIPAFSLERTQELLHLMSHLDVKVPVYMDSPMAQKATQIYNQHYKVLNEEIQNDFKKGNPFSFSNLQIVKTGKDSASLNETAGPKIIIAGSGMMTGGRIVDHARALLPIPTTRLLIVGYQGEETLGRMLLEGEKVVTIYDQKIKVNGHISSTQAMSSHADQSQLLNWLGKIQGVKKVILTHGEDGPREILAKKIGDELDLRDVTLPHLNEEIEI